MEMFVLGALVMWLVLGFFALQGLARDWEGKVWFWEVLGLLALPFFRFGFWVGELVRKYRRHRSGRF
jgi:hypothetical protein